MRTEQPQYRGADPGLRGDERYPEPAAADADADLVEALDRGQDCLPACPPASP
ncbi:hypothetical protein [Streptomyces sp. WM6372]|uniref:hypothetical protein n=1 Tax=Streptomyces sp. WM6372 TaxID=1415555 RepID=UPI0018FE2491|nr:hypothetical protein [Streptomyces sp. WM6372]